MREEEKKRKIFSPRDGNFFLSLSPYLLGAGNAVAGAVVGEDASGADMAETWLPRPVSSCRGVHVAASCAR